MIKAKDKIRLELKNYLELNNVSFLFGTGSSMVLEAVSIRDIPELIELKIREDADLYKLFVLLIKEYQKKDEEKKLEGNSEVKKDDDGVVRWIDKKDKGEKLVNIATPLENFIDYLLGLQFIMEYSDLSISGNQIDKGLLKRLIDCIKTELFKLCDLKYESSELKYHKKFVKSLLGRPLNLRRANIFTTNYDLAFEDTFEELGVHYVNGFLGFNKRYFKPEVYDYDMFYPGNLTEGKVSRVEKVVKYYKLHGSLTWINEDQKANNIYGIRELPIELIRNKYEESGSSEIGDIMIYPTSYKKGYTLDFPYSELFRQFASAITQPQSVLFCVGYSFFDEHINDIIFQALSIPSFTLVIVDYKGTSSNENMKKLMELNDPRIIILEGPYLGDFKLFADEIMPDFHEIDVDEKVAVALNKLYSTETRSEVQCLKEE